MSAQVVVIGAGHNGLIAAYYLAKSGVSVTVIEGRNTLGGACVTETLPCGCKISPGANHFGILHPKIRADISWVDREKRVVVPNPQGIVLLGSGRTIAFYRDREEAKKEIAQYSIADAVALDGYSQDLATASNLFWELAIQDRYSQKDLYETLETVRPGLGRLFLTNSVQETLSYYFRSEEVRAAFLASAILYSCDPSESGSAYSLMYVAGYNVYGEPGWGIIPGGMGEVSRHIAMRAELAGARIVLGAPVREICLDGDRIKNIVYGEQQILQPDFVLSCADPVTTQGLLSPHESQRLSRLVDLPMASGAAKFNFLLKQPPSLVGVEAKREAEALRTISMLCPSTKYISKAHVDCQRNASSAQPYIELLLPSMSDPSTSCGRHVVGSAFIMFAPAIWENCPKGRAPTPLLRILDDHFPGLSSSIEWCEYLGVSGLQRRFNLYGGNVDHGDMRPGNRFEDRFGVRNNRRPFDIDNLIMCGSSSFPGGLVSGVPGYLAALEVAPLLGA